MTLALQKMMNLVPSSKHLLASCPVYQGLTVKEKWEVVKEHKIVGIIAQNSPLGLQLHCQNHSPLHMAYLKAQFLAQRFWACTWMMYPKSSSLVISNPTLMTLRYILRPRQRTLIHVYAKLLRISILGPTLFSLYMNDLPKVIKFSNIESYVHDTKIYFSFASKDIDSCLRQVAKDLKHVSEWCCANHLLINPVWGEATYLQVAQ